MKGKAPVVRQVSWPFVLPQIAAMAASVFVVYVVLRPQEFVHALMIGCGIYLVYSIGSRRLITRAHRKGIRLSKRGEFREAIEHYRRSHDFFTMHPWVDKYRSIILMSCSAISYREMALVNMGFCYGQIGEAQKAKECYQAAVDAFPRSAMAASALRMIDTFESKGKPEPATAADGEDAAAE